MHVELVDGDACEAVRGRVVVIDVLRAFTTAAYAFAAGAGEIMLASSVAEALALAGRFPGALLVGEVNSRPVPGFDHGNSPAEIAGLDLGGRRLVQRTSAGTRSAVACRSAEVLLLGSFVCARATARHLIAGGQAPVSLVCSGRHRGGGGDEDLACAEYLRALLRGEPAELEPLLRRVRDSPAARKFLDPWQPDFSARDLELAVDADRFDFTMSGRWHDHVLVVTKQPG